MQATAINNPSAVPVTTAPQGSQTGTTAAGADFMTMMMQLMGGQQDSGMEGGLIDFGGAESMLPTGKTSDQDLAAMQQQLAGMFAGMPFDFSTTPSPMGYKDDAAMANFATGNTTGTQTMPSNIDPNQLNALMNTLAAEGSSQGGSMQELLAQMQATANQEPTITDPTLAKLAITDPKLAQEVREALAKAEGGAQTQATTKATPLDPLQSAYAKLNRTATPQTAKDAKPLDIEAMQQAVDSGRYLTQTAVQKDMTLTAPHTMDILEQVRTGITDKLAAGDTNEFVLKLKPEGLGQITVKMVETDGKISLSIITSSQQAQNALSSQLGSLKEALRPFHAEVSQIVTQDHSMNQNNPNQSGFQQNFAEQHRGQNSQQNPQNHFWQTESETPREAEGYHTAPASSAALNAYI